MAKTIVLSITKQTVLATLYLVGVREITLQINDICIWMKEGYFGPYSKVGFGGNIPKITADFSFDELEEIFGTHFQLYDVINECCPQFQYVLKSK